MRGAPVASEKTATDAWPSGSKRYSVPSAADAHVVTANGGGQRPSDGSIASMRGVSTALRSRLRTCGQT